MKQQRERPLRNSRQPLTELDAFEHIRRLFSLIMLPMGAMACLLAWGMQLTAGHIGDIDLYFLPLFALTLGLSAVLVWVQRAALPWIERGGFVVFSAYLLITLQAQLHGNLPVSGYLSPIALWFFIDFLLAFIAWEPRRALQLCAGIYAIMLLLLVLNLPMLLPQKGPLFLHAINYVIQFYAACLLYIAAHYTLAQLRPQLKAMQNLALSDPLTGVANRRRGEELLAQEIARAERYGHPLSVVMFDLDHFKRVNDTHGHAVGDALLRAVTHVVEKQLRAADHLARWGGEEFLVIAPELGDRRAVQVAERMRDQISQLHIPGHRQMSQTASFGVAFYRAGDTPHGLVQRADEALYAAKNGGRNRVEQAASQTAVRSVSEPSSMKTA